MIREGAEKDSTSQESLKLEDPAQDDPEPKVRLDAAEDDEAANDDNEQEAEKKPLDGQPRKKDGRWAEKKAARGKEHRESRAWEKERADYDRRFQQMIADQDRRYKQLADEFDRFRQTARGGQQANPFDAQLAEIERQLEQELALIETDEKRGYKQYNQLRRQEQMLITQQAIAMRDQQEQQRRQAQPQDPYQHRRPIISMEFPWTDDPRYDDLSKKARAYRDYLIHHEGMPDTIDTDRQALTTTVAKFGADYGLRPPPAPPSQRTRNLWQGPPSRNGADRRPAPREVDLGEMGRGHGLNARALAAAVGEALRDEN